MRLPFLQSFLAIGFIVAVATTMATTQSNQASTSPSSAGILNAARDALGGESKLAAIKAMILKGEERDRNEWYSGAPGGAQEYMASRIEVSIMLPDRYVLSSEPSFGNAYRVGFKGSAYVPFARETPITVEVVKGLRARMSSMMLGMIMRTDTPILLMPEVVNGSGDSIEFKGLGLDSGFLDLDKKTHLPMCVRYRLSSMSMSGTPTGEVMNIVVAFNDWRNVGGLKLPYHISHMRNDKLSEDIRITSILLNPPLTDADFK